MKDFRCKESMLVKDRFGNKVKLQVCEEFVAGRWEGFISILTTIKSNKYHTKEEN